MSLIADSLASIREVPTDIKLSKFLDDEEGDMIVMEIREELLKNVMERIQVNDLRTHAQKFVVKCAIEAIKQAVGFNNYFHNVCYSSMEEGSWEADVPCPASNADSWAAYRIPLTYSREEDEQKVDSQSSLESRVVKSSEQTEAKPEIPLKHVSSSSSSQDLFLLTEYLEDLSTFSSEEGDTDSSDNASLLDRLSHLTSSLSGKVSARLSARLSSRLSDKFSDYGRPITPEIVTSAYSKTVIGETDKGLCMPHVGNVPNSNVVMEIPETDDFTLVKVQKRIIKVSKKSKSFPRRRSVTKFKILPILEDSPKDKGMDRRKP